MQITINQKDLKAVAYAMPEKDIRYYLNGVLLETNGAETRLVATDGHRLHIVRASDPVAAVVEPVTIILPAELVKSLIKAKFGRGSVKAFTLEIDINHISAAMPDGNNLSCKGIDGKFPNWRRVVPTECSGEYAYLNPQYRLDAAKAWGEYVGNTFIVAPDLAYNGSMASAVLSDDGFLAIIMPLLNQRLTDKKIDPRFVEPLSLPKKPWLQEGSNSLAKVTEESVVE